MSAATPGLLPAYNNVELLALALRGGPPATADDLQRQGFEYLQGRLIDPIAVASQQQDRSYQQAAEAVDEQRIARRARAVDLGAAAIDDRWLFWGTSPGL